MNRDVVQARTLLLGASRERWLLRGLKGGGLVRCFGLLRQLRLEVDRLFEGADLRQRDLNRGGLRWLWYFRMLGCRIFTHSLGLRRRCLSDLLGQG